jgi:hypothetical protein
VFKWVPEWAKSIESSSKSSSTKGAFSPERCFSLPQRAVLFNRGLAALVGTIALIVAVAQVVLTNVKRRNRRCEVPVPKFPVTPQLGT